MLLKQSTAQTVVIGPILDADGVAVTTAVIGNVSIAKNGSAAALTTETLTHLANGYYTLALTTSNTNTLGILAAYVNNTAMSMTVFRWNVIVASAYDAIVNNATNATGGLLTATGSVSAIAGALLNTTNLPSNFAALGINASGHVSRVTLVDTTTTNTDMRGTDGAALASNWTATRAGYLDGVLIAANYNQRTVSVTGSNHVAADVHEFQPGVITSGDFSSGAITSTVLATDSITSSQLAANAVTEIQSGLATTTQLTTVEGKIDTIDNFVDTEVAAIKAKTDQLTFTVANQVDANALTGGGGGGDSIIVTPVVAQAPVRTVATNISTFKGDRSAITVGVFDELDPVDLTSLGALEVCIQTKAGTDLQVIANANITISGADNNYFSFSPGSAAVATVGRFMWSLRVAASNSKRVIAYGAWIVEDAALNDV